MRIAGAGGSVLRVTGAFARLACAFYTEGHHVPMPAEVLTVTALNARIRATLEASHRALWVEGELSNVKVMPGSGHAYFTLKDAGAQLSAVMFAGSLRGVAFRLVDGAKVRAYGNVTMYEPRGQCQLSVQKLEKVGAGDLMAQFEALKRKLQAEGLFDATRKRPLPLLPRVVGIATSPTGAAIRDMFNVTRRRFPNLRILLAPCRVQGDGAAAEIAAAVRTFNALRDERRPDVLIVGRGGGSAEDLWCFNDEALARAVAASEIPVISAVGHEVDFTICDFVADLRAPTPSAAAELVVGRKDEFLQKLATARTALEREARHALEAARARVGRARDHRVFAQPRSLVQQHRQRLDLADAALRAALSGASTGARRALDAAAPRMRYALADAVSRRRQDLAALPPRLGASFAARRASLAQRLDALRRQLGALSPLAVLQRGYGIVRGPDGAILRSPKGLSPGDVVTATLAGGDFAASVLPGTKKTTSRTPKAKTPPDEALQQLSLF